MKHLSLALVLCSTLSCFASIEVNNHSDEDLSITVRDDYGAYTGIARAHRKALIARAWYIRGLLKLGIIPKCYLKYVSLQLSSGPLRGAEGKWEITQNITPPLTTDNRTCDYIFTTSLKNGLPDVIQVIQKSLLFFTRDFYDWQVTHSDQDVRRATEANTRTHDKTVTTA